MKTQINSIIFALTLFLTGLYPWNNVQAQTISYSYAEELPNGYYITTFVETLDSNARSSTKTATKTCNISSNTGEVVATYKLIASFSYPYNDTARCTSTTYSTSVNDSSWSFSDCSADKSGNKATGHFIIKKTFLGITRDTIEKTITITCDKNGNIS